MNIYSYKIIANIIFPRLISLIRLAPEPKGLGGAICGAVPSHLLNGKDYRLNIKTISF